MSIKSFFQSIPSYVDAVSDRIAVVTKPFVESKVGKIFLQLTLIGPLTFLPTIYAVWTAPNIDAFRTWTWPTLILVNISATLGCIHSGQWIMRLVMSIWVLCMTAVWVATLVR